MELLKLPPKILHLILIQASLQGRVVKRTLRLRLVCKAFAGALYPALFETHLMDDTLFKSGDGTLEWQGRNQHGSEELWQEYLVFRVLRERDVTVGRYVEMREIAQAICRETEGKLQLRATIEGLCWLTLKHGSPDTPASGYRAPWGPTKTRTQGFKTNLDLNLLSTATHFNILPLTRRLISKGHDPTKHNFLFAPAIQVAAQDGNIAMLQYFQEQLQLSRFESWSVTGAAIRNDMAVLNIALPLRLPNRDGISLGGEAGPVYGSIDHTTEEGREVLVARKHASTPEVFEYLTSALTPWSTAVQDAYEDLEHFALLGNLPMTRYLLGLGVPVQKPQAGYETPLLMACRGLHNDMVDLLLEHGADPNFCGCVEYASLPLHEASTACSLTLVRKLLDHGADIEPLALAPTGYPVLWWAFAQEHEAMINMLLDHGATLDGRDNSTASGWHAPKGFYGQELAKMVHYLGYNSMAKLLRCKLGWQVINPDPQLHKDKGVQWHMRWKEAQLVRRSLRRKR